MVGEAAARLDSKCSMVLFWRITIVGFRKELIFPNIIIVDFLKSLLLTIVSFQSWHYYRDIYYSKILNELLLSTNYSNTIAMFYYLSNTFSIIRFCIIVKMQFALFLK